MSSLDLNRLFQAHVLLSCVAALSEAPTWNPAIAIVGLVLVPKMEADAGGAEAARHFVSVIGGSVILDFFWFTSHSTHGLSRLCILLNWLLKLITMLNMSSALQARGQAGGFSFPGAGNMPGGFTLPGGLGDRFASVFPPAGMQGQQQNQQQQGPQGRETSETVWSAPGSYQQNRFSLDEEESVGSMTPPVTVSGVQSPLGESKVGGGPGAAAGPPAPAYGKSAGRHGAGSSSEGGGYHTLE